MRHSRSVAASAAAAAGRGAWAVAAGRPGRPVSDEVMVHAEEANRADWPLTELHSCTHTAMNVSFLRGLSASFFFSSSLHPSAVLRLFTLHSLMVVCLLLQLFFSSHVGSFIKMNADASKERISWNLRI